MLGIGERTLYRMIQDWKLQDQIREALAETDGNVAAAAKQLGMTADGAGAQAEETRRAGTRSSSRTRQRARWRAGLRCCPLCDSGR